MTGDAGGWLITDRLFGVAERDAGRELVVDTAPVWHLGGLFTGSTSWRKITAMKKRIITISALSARIAAASFHRFFRKEHPDCARSSVRPLTLRRTHPRSVKWNRVRPNGRETRRLEPRRSSQLSQDSESGFLREGTRLRRVGGAREARARKGRRACLVGLRRSLASGLSGRRTARPEREAPVLSTSEHPWSGADSRRPPPRRRTPRRTR